MQPTTEILERISKDSLTHKEEVFTRLYRYLLRPDIYYQAYQRLYTNKGASTKGINQDTADGFSEAKIEKIIQSLADETYQPTPVRRTYIAKKSNPKKKRPLGIPTFTDKLVQEALRMILEAIYELSGLLAWIPPEKKLSHRIRQIEVPIWWCALVC